MSPDREALLDLEAALQAASAVGFSAASCAYARRELAAVAARLPAMAWSGREQIAGWLAGSMLPFIGERILAGAPDPETTAPPARRSVNVLEAAGLFADIEQMLARLGQGERAGAAGQALARALGQRVKAHADGAARAIVGEDFPDLPAASAELMRLDIHVLLLETLGREAEVAQARFHIRRFARHVLRRVTALIAEFLATRAMAARVGVAGVTAPVEDLILLVLRLFEGEREEHAAGAVAYLETLGQQALNGFAKQARLLLAHHLRGLKAAAQQPVAPAIQQAMLRQVEKLIAFGQRLSEADGQGKLAFMAIMGRDELVQIGHAIAEAPPGSPRAALVAQAAALAETMRRLGWQGERDRLEQRWRQAGLVLPVAAHEEDHHRQ
ncbi:MAG: hypothetical protein OHK0024_31100 [Thalassobaculales bacterium]